MHQQGRPVALCISSSPSHAQHHNHCPCRVPVAAAARPKVLWAPEAHKVSGGAREAGGMPTQRNLKRPSARSEPPKDSPSASAAPRLSRCAHIGPPGSFSASHQSTGCPAASMHTCTGSYYLCSPIYSSLSSRGQRAYKGLQAPVLVVSRVDTECQRQGYKRVA